MLGELQTSIMLGRAGPKAAAGWDGDRYAVFEGPPEKLGLVWLSTWDGEDDAREFAQAYTRYQTRRMGKDAYQPERIPDSLWRVQRQRLPGRRTPRAGRGRDRGLRTGRHRKLARIRIQSQQGRVPTDATQGTGSQINRKLRCRYIDASGGR